jgi:hypothetical protein
MDSSTQDMARGEAGASPGRAPADEREQGEFLRLFKDFKDNPSLKGDAGFRERVATFLDSLDPVRVASTVVNQNELLRTPSGSRQQLSADAQSQVDFTEAFLAPYALERGMVAKTGDKKAMYKDTYVKPYTAAETEVVRELAEVEARLSTLNPQQEIASGGGRFEAYQQLRERRLALSVEQVDILESRRPDSEKNNPEWLEREAKRALTEVSSGSAPVATTGQEAASSEDLRAALGLMSAEAYFGAGNVSRPAEGGGVKAAGTAAGTVGTMETVGTMGTMGTAAGEEKKREEGENLPINAMDNSTLNGRLPAEGGGVKAAVVAASEEGGVKAAAVAASEEGGVKAAPALAAAPAAAGAVAEQDISYAALARRWHEKDIANAVGFVGQSRQVDVGAPEAVRQLSFLEAHNNLLTREEATVVKLHVSEAALREQFPFLHERVSRQGKDFGEVVESACRGMEAITQEVKEQRGGQWTFDSIAKAKGYEGEVMQRLQGSPSLSRFHELRIGNNRDIAYQLNQAADISVFVEAAGYKKTKGSTERWPRYEKGKSVLLVTEHNTVKDVKSGESRNLFAFIKEEFPNTSKASDTVHFIATVMKYPESERSGALHLGWQQQRQGQPRAEGSAQGQGSGVKKEFRLSDYRLEPLNTGKNYLHDQRGIAQETLEHPNFKGAILQGNRQYRLNSSGAQVEVPRWQNNVVYPFKQRPDAANGEMTTLLQQYGEKFKLGDKLVDKVFAPGSGKHSAAWFSNLPEKAEQLLVVENPLDALSHYQLHQPAGALYMATGGRPAVGQLALIDEVCQKHNIPNKRLAFDNDMAGHSFDAQYIAHKTPMYGIKTVPDSGDKEFTVEYRQLKPAQHAALSKAAEKNPNAVCRDDGSIAVRVKTPEELSRCNKYAAKFLAEDKSLDFAKSQAKDFNDDLKAALALGRKKPQAVALPKSNGMKM